MTSKSITNAGIERALAAKRESTHIEFKEQFDTVSDGDWCEMIKDFAAMSNSGGGLIVIGLRNNGTPSGAAVAPVLALDPASITDKMFKYTGGHYGGFEIHEGKRDGKYLAIIAVDAVPVPIAFSKPGTYLLDATTAKQKTAFSQGTVYVRHGAKSEPATSADLSAFIDRRIEVVRKAWLGNIRKLVKAPPDAEVGVYRSASAGPTTAPARIQFTDDPGAPVYGRMSIDDTHPYRQKELIGEVNRRLGGKVVINSRDVLCVRVVENIDETTSPEFCARGKYVGAPQYSEAFVDWLVDRHKRDKRFFANERARYSTRMHSDHDPDA